MYVLSSAICRVAQRLSHRTARHPPWRRERALSVEPQQRRHLPRARALPPEQAEAGTMPARSVSGWTIAIARRHDPPRRSDPGLLPLVVMIPAHGKQAQEPGAVRSSEGHVSYFVRSGAYVVTMHIESPAWQVLTLETITKFREPSIVTSASLFARDCVRSHRLLRMPGRAPHATELPRKHVIASRRGWSPPCCASLAPPTRRALQANDALASVRQVSRIAPGEEVS